MYKHDDFRPYLYKTSDYGKTWKKIVNGIGAESFTRVIREDPARRGLLYAGTELGMYVSFDDGENWQAFQLNMPVVPVTDLTVHAGEKDLIVATQGRSFYVLDDLTLLHQMKDEIAGKALHVFTPEHAYRLPSVGFSEGRANSPLGMNPVDGVPVFVWFQNEPKEEVKVGILDAAGKLVREDKFKAKAGLNRYIWDLRYADAKTFPGLILWAGNTRGPRAAPGMYTVRVNGVSERIEVRKDPRLTTSPADYAAQLELSLQLRDKLSETHQAILDIRAAKEQLTAGSARWKDQAAAQALIDAAAELEKRLTAIEVELYQTRNRSNQDPLNYPIKLNNKLAALLGVVQSADAAPTEQSKTLYEELATAINAQLAKLAAIRRDEFPAFNKKVQEANLPMLR